MSATLTTTPDTAALAMSRRALLRRLGIGAGAVAVVVGGGVAWRVADQGVLTPGAGPERSGLAHVRAVLPSFSLNNLCVSVVQSSGLGRFALG